MIKTFKGWNHKEVDREFNQYEVDNKIEVIHMSRYIDNEGSHYMSIYYKPKHFTI